ncbi:hypothetical protein Bca101_092211 [Brassica carinata]
MGKRLLLSLSLVFGSILFASLAYTGILNVIEYMGSSIAIALYNQAATSLCNQAQVGIRNKNILLHLHRAFKMVTRSVDLRSDTVTRPTDAMREAMASAEVDDDILGYDPTARHLEEEMAKMMGKEAALFVPSGTMGNLICVMVHCEVRGSEVILGDNSHIHVYENGGISTIGGVHPKTVKNEEDGTMELGAIEAAIRDPKGSTFYPSTMLICLENTHANSGGRCLSAEYTDSVGKIAKRHGLKLHIDGARLFNASIALGVPVHRLVEAADSVSVCLSKGLGAPVGTVIVGSHTFIEKAKTLRKTLGGGMRQIGVLCAAALVALQENLPKLQFDHKKAKLLAEGLNQMKGIRINAAAVETNMIFMDMEDGSRLTAEKLRKSLTECGILVLPGNSSGYINIDFGMWFQDKNGCTPPDNNK